MFSAIILRKQVSHRQCKVRGHGTVYCSSVVDYHVRMYTDLGTRKGSRGEGGVGEPKTMLIAYTLCTILLRDLAEPDS